jgi:hypothetical protein
MFTRRSDGRRQTISVAASNVPSEYEPRIRREVTLLSRAQKQETRISRIQQTFAD